MRQPEGNRSRIATTAWTDTPVVSSLCDAALMHEDCIVDASRDPNLLHLCVEYLDKTQAIPPMADDTRWFADMLSVLVELAIPNSISGPDSEGLYREIDAGIAVSRSTYALNGQSDT